MFFFDSRPGRWESERVSERKRTDYVLFITYDRISEEDEKKNSWTFYTEIDITHIARSKLNFESKKFL